MTRRSKSKRITVNLRQGPSGRFFDRRTGRTVPIKKVLLRLRIAEGVHRSIPVWTLQVNYNARFSADPNDYAENVQDVIVFSARKPERGIQRILNNLQKEHPGLWGLSYTLQRGKP